MRVLAIDIGSSAVKAGYWDGGRFRARARVGFRTEYRGVCVEAPAGRILRALEAAGREVLRGAEAVDVVSYCTFSPGVVVLDGKGRVRAGAITHQDRRSVMEARSLASFMGKKWLLAHTGNLPYPGGIGSSTLAWLYGFAGELFRGDYRVGQLSSVVGWMLTGEWAIDRSQAVFLGLWDIRAHGWNERMCEQVGVKLSSLPRVVWADDIVGRVTAGAARVLGLRVGTPVVGGFVDGSAAVIQTPMGDGQLAHTCGSTDVLAMCVEKPLPAEGILTRPVGVGKAMPERWLAVRTIAAAGSALDWARRVMFSELSEEKWRRTLGRCIKKTNSGDDLICVPSFAGERTRMERSHYGMFGNITLASGREQMLGALVRGLTRQSWTGYQALAQLQRPARVVYEMGGATALGEAMRGGWAEGHEFRRLAGDGLRGLVELAGRVVGD